eukprot:6214772-Pleurochrysis_carterae.AAC.7
MELKFDMIWARTVEVPPFKADNIIAVNFLYTVLDSLVGTRIQHSFAITEAVATRRGQSARVRAACRPASRLQLACPLYQKQKFPVPSKGDLRRLSTDPEGRWEGSTGRRARGLLERHRVAVNQLRRDTNFADRTTVEAEKQLLLRRLTQD